MRLSEQKDPSAKLYATALIVASRRDGEVRQLHPRLRRGDPVAAFSVSMRAAGKARERRIPPWYSK
jgi:hypothetical protein